MSANLTLYAVNATLRTKAILETATRDFIKSGRPITSEYLYETYDFGIKPATIRLELSALAEDGYFYQNHPSGGRYPTNKAYEIFVGMLMRGTADRVAKNMLAFAESFISEERGDFIEELAGRFGVLSVGRDTHGIYVSSLHDFLDRVEVREKGDLIDIVHDCELLPECLLEHANELLKETPRVFIGSSPFVRNDDTSVVAGSFQNGTFILAMVGPKRMDYAKSIALFRSLAEVLG